MATGTGSPALVPNPTAVRMPRRLIEHNTTADWSTIPFGEGYSWVNGVPQSIILPVAGAARFRIRWLSAASGSLTAAFLRPDMVTPYAQNNPGAVAVTGGTETALTVDPHEGEAAIKITFTPSSSAVHNYSDICEV